jgi:iron-sulfur cluster assembly enzyme ISCU, mitochondrial
LGKLSESLQIHTTEPLNSQIVFAMFSLSLLKKVKVCQKGTIFVRLYHENIIDHYENPRNVGSLDKKKITVGTGLVGAPACGDVMKLQFEVDDTGRIIDAKFKTFGCGSAIASSSVATEWLKGKTVDECLTIKVMMLSIL